MPGGGFNVAALIKELGLKPVGPDEMRVRGDIQPVLIAGDLSATTPAHEQPAAMFGTTISGAPGTAALFELQSLSPGGGFVGFVSSVQSTGVRMRVVTAGSGISTVLAPAGVLSRAPLVSIVRIGDVAPSAEPFIAFASTLNATQYGWHDIYVPTGSFFQLESASLNNSIQVGIHWREVVAAENVPA